MAIASQFDAQRRRRCGSRRLLLLQSVVRRCVDAVAAVAVTGRMRSVGRLEQPRDTMARQTSARFRIRIGSTSFVPYFDQRRDSDVEQEILETEAMAGQQDRKEDGQVVMDRIVLLQNAFNARKRKKLQMSFVYLDIDLSQHVHISLGREAKGHQNSQERAEHPAVSSTRRRAMSLSLSLSILLQTATTTLQTKL